MKDFDIVMLLLRSFIVHNMSFWHIADKKLCVDYL